MMSVSNLRMKWARCSPMFSDDLWPKCKCGDIFRRTCIAAPRAHVRHFWATGTPFQTPLYNSRASRMTCPHGLSAYSPTAKLLRSTQPKWVLRRLLKNLMEPVHDLIRWPQKGQSESSLTDQISLTQVGAQTVTMGTQSSATITNWQSFKEPMGAWGGAFNSTGLVEQISTTRDSTDYLWYTTRCVTCITLLLQIVLHGLWQVSCHVYHSQLPRAGE